MLIDAWIQHPTPKFLGDPIFASLLRWTKQEDALEIPLEATLNALRVASVDRALISAWYGPTGAMISNKQVATWVSKAPDLLVGVGSVDLTQPRRAVLQVRKCVEEYGFKAIRVLPWLWNFTALNNRGADVLDSY